MADVLNGSLKFLTTVMSTFAFKWNYKGNGLVEYWLSYDPGKDSPILRGRWVSE